MKGLSVYPLRTQLRQDAYALQFVPYFVTWFVAFAECAARARDLTKASKVPSCHATFILFNHLQIAGEGTWGYGQNAVVRVWYQQFEMFEFPWRQSCSLVPYSSGRFATATR